MDWNLPSEMGVVLGRRAKEVRLALGWKQATLAARAGVTQASLKRFENTGKSSLELVLRVADALGRLEEFGQLLLPAPARTLDELEKREVSPAKRGRR